MPAVRPARSRRTGAEEHADELLSVRRLELDHLADLLLERETLEGEELRAGLGVRERIPPAA